MTSKDQQIYLLYYQKRVARYFRIFRLDYELTCFIHWSVKCYVQVFHLCWKIIFVWLTMYIFKLTFRQFIVVFYKYRYNWYFHTWQMLVTFEEAVGLWFVQSHTVLVMYEKVHSMGNLLIIITYNDFIMILQTKKKN